MKNSLHKTEWSMAKKSMHRYKFDSRTKKFCELEWKKKKKKKLLFNQAGFWFSLIFYKYLYKNSKHSFPIVLKAAIMDWKAKFNFHSSSSLSY